MAPKAPRPTPHQDALLDRTGIIGASSRGSTVPPRPGINRSGAAGFMAFVLMVVAGVTGLSEVDGAGDGSTLIAGDEVVSPAPVPEPRVPNGARPDSEGGAPDVRPGPVTPGPSVPSGGSAEPAPEPSASESLSPERPAPEPQSPGPMANSPADSGSGVSGSANSGDVDSGPAVSAPRGLMPGGGAERFESRSNRDAVDRARTVVREVSDAMEKRVQHHMRATMLRQQRAMLHGQAAGSTTTTGAEAYRAPQRHSTEHRNRDADRHDTHRHHADRRDSSERDSDRHESYRHDSAGHDSDRHESNRRSSYRHSQSVHHVVQRSMPAEPHIEDREPERVRQPAAPDSDTGLFGH